MSKFQTIDEYYQWCDEMITKIYYANIAMNHDAIRDVVEKIGSVLHVPEGESLIAPSDTPIDAYTRVGDEVV